MQMISNLKKKFPGQEASWEKCKSKTIKNEQKHTQKVELES